jgi:hypothetical protein
MIDDQPIAAVAQIELYSVISIDGSEFSDGIDAMADEVHDDLGRLG